MRVRWLHERAGFAHVAPLATKRHSLGDEVPLLPRALGQRAVGADHPPPGKVRVLNREEDGPGKPRRPRRHVPVGAHKSLRDLPHPLQHLHLAHAVGPKAAMMRFWYSLSSSGEMKYVGGVRKRPSARSAVASTRVRTLSSGPAAQYVSTISSLIAAGTAARSPRRNASPAATALSAKPCSSQSGM